eukprot:TRINITY_DN55981_c0_g1_i1.p1 TRINITY_DN55981_c0_g1~~TRINITY_DN55981_c0_g1_i1.p1  ORF type:complete len:546 (-),score=58.44 TRINITY_DN55981_c0_g1_i1:140-1777(-)
MAELLEKEPRYIQLLEEYRVALLALCLPISFLYGCLMAFKRWISSALASHPPTHEGRVELIKKVLVERAKLPPEERKKITTDRPTTDALTTGFYDKSKRCRVPTSCLRHILKLDVEKQTVTVEPMVSVEDAANFLVPRGFILASHLEYGRATLGGLAMAVGMTTHAHHTGLLQETVLSYDIVLANGEFLHVTEDGPHSDLFHALPWSHGTLGTIVALELKVLPIKKYVRLKYIPVSGMDNIMRVIREQSGALDPNAKTSTFCEATLFSKDKGVITVGDFDDGKSKPSPPVNPLARWYKPWWYKHVEEYSKRGEAGEELVPVRDYLLRHTRSIFWVIELMVPYGNHPLFRWVFGWLLPLDVTFMKLTTTSGVRKLTFMKQVFQDITMPMTEMERAVDLSATCFDLWPLLIYPCKEFDKGPGKGQLRPPRPEQLCPGSDPKWGMFFDLGIYGVPGYLLRKEPYNPSRAMTRYTKFVKEIGGHPFLYADQFYSEKDFEEMFDLTCWRSCRKKYHAEGNFPTLWEKVGPEVDIVKIGDMTLFPNDEKKD